jgi:hypothetical protein
VVALVSARRGCWIRPVFPIDRIGEKASTIAAYQHGAAEFVASTSAVDQDVIDAIDAFAGMCRTGAKVLEIGSASGDFPAVLAAGLVSLVARNPWSLAPIGEGRQSRWPQMAGTPAQAITRLHSATPSQTSTQATPRRATRPRLVVGPAAIQPRHHLRSLPPGSPWRSIGPPSITAARSTSTTAARTRPFVCDPVWGVGACCRCMYRPCRVDPTEERAVSGLPGRRSRLDILSESGSRVWGAPPAGRCRDLAFSSDHTRSRQPRPVG